jgi:hypothetical protein
VDKVRSSFLHNSHQPLLLLDQLVDASGFAVEEIGDSLLGGEVGNAEPHIPDEIPRCARHLCSISRGVDCVYRSNIDEPVPKKTRIYVRLRSKHKRFSRALTCEFGSRNFCQIWPQLPKQNVTRIEAVSCRFFSFS